MDSLPNEIIEHILMDPVLSIKDVVNFSSVCSKFRDIVTLSSAIGKSKYFQRWPYTDSSVEISEWYEECVTRIHFEKRAIELLSEMSCKFYLYEINDISSPKLEFVIDFMNSHKYGYFYLRDFLLEIKSLPLTQSLTHKYYSTILLKFINKRHYTQVWHNLLQLNPKDQTLEKGAIFVSLWCQENVRDISRTVKSDLDKTAELTKLHLLKQLKDHPLKDVPEDIYLSWREQNISDNYFEPTHCISIIESINYVLFEQLKYCIANEISGMEKKKRGIDYAILDRKATSLIFAVIYESVARRLGVKIEILHFLDHCLLKWKESYCTPDAPFHYISTSNKGLFMKSRCPRISNNHPVIPPCDMQQIAQTAAYSIYTIERGEHYLIEKDALELFPVIHPFSLEWYQQLSSCYMLHNMDVQELIGKLLSLKHQMTGPEKGWFLHLLHSLETYQKTWEKEHNSEKTLKVHRRDKNVEFAVGMIVRDKLLNKVGVIYGWFWNTFKCVDGKVGQWLYHILEENGLTQQVPQDYLQILHSPSFIFHPSFGRFFEEYCTTYYKPNKELQSEYPDDMEALQKILKEDRDI